MYQYSILFVPDNFGFNYRTVPVYRYRIYPTIIPGGAKSAHHGQPGGPLEQVRHGEVP
jgi:hypothetical protein